MFDCDVMINSELILPKAMSYANSVDLTLVLSSSQEERSALLFYTIFKIITSEAPLIEEITFQKFEDSISHQILHRQF
ncbi:hypothetical protein T07_12491 [Trichinella nelsoni]|uniref:Uncharacterized protein n=1 Tax=Trichinella nelsoni TaxID=6336 RepID=A0A0V0RY82_9BILA|nr:hypothetical protein T07_12491 [Trichinella nelsoni]